MALLERTYQVVPFVFAPRRKWLTPWVLVRQLLFLLRHQPHAAACVVQFGGYHSFLPALLGSMIQVPVMIVLGGFDCASFPSFHYGAHHRFPMGWVTRAAMRLATRLVAVSDNLVLSESKYSLTEGDPRRQGYRAFGPSITTPCTVLAYGYNAERFKPNDLRKPRSFLTVAQMNSANFHRKGVDLMFALAERFPDCSFTLVGNSPSMRYDRVPPNVELIGSVQYNELPMIYAHHVFYLQLSIWEGFPSAPCEAMLCGCVPIVSNVAALPEIIGDTGFVLQTRDIEVLTPLVDQALRSDVQDLSSKARERIIERYPEQIRNRLVVLVMEMRNRKE